MKSFVWWLIPQHVLAVLVGLLTFGFAAATLRQRRPTGSAAAWLLLIVMVPYVGIPLYLSFGGRKVKRRALKKIPLAARAESLRLAFTQIRALGSRSDGSALEPADSSRVEWLADGVAAYGAFLAEIAAAKRSIRVQTFILGDDSTGRGILDALIAPPALRLPPIAALSLGSLAALGAFGAHLGGASLGRAALRVTLGGSFAMAVTAIIGRLIGGSVG